MLIVSFYDVFESLNNHSGGSIPLLRRCIMAKKQKVSRMLSTFRMFMSSWVVRAALLALGMWVFPLQPNGHLQSN